MEFLIETITAVTWQQVVMWCIGLVLIYLAIKKDMEPALLLPIGFGAILVNIPFSNVLSADGSEGIIQWLFEVGIEASEALPILLFIGIGAMIDFEPLIVNPKMMLMGAFAQLGIFVTMILAVLLGFSITDAASVGIIGAADGPTSILVAMKLKSNYVGAIMELCQDNRGVFTDMTYLDAKRVRLNYKLPLNEIIFDFFDGLKSRTRGYASFDYELDGYQKSELVKLDMLLNGEPCDALSIIVHKDKAYQRGRALAERLKDVIPRQLFEIPIQAAIGGKVIARETVKALRKDVLAKCYGGDITRKKKLLEKQKEGKKKMRQLGSVEVPSEAFMSILKIDSSNDK